MNREELERLTKPELIELLLGLQRPSKTSRTSSKPPSTDRKAKRDSSRPGGAKPAQSPGRSENGQRLEQGVNTAGPSRAFSCCDAVDPAKDWARATRIVSLLTVAFPSILATGLCSLTVPEAVAARRHRRGEDSTSHYHRIPSSHSSPGRRHAKISIT